MSVRTNPAASLFPLLIAGLLAGISYWLELTSRAPLGRDDGKSRHDPDYIVEKFEVRRFDKLGSLQHTMVADLMRHYPDDDSTVVLAPRLTYHRDPPTRVSAREAHVSSKGEHVELIDDVRVVRAGQQGKPDTILSTSRLDAWPDDEIARTNQPVVITQGQTHVEGSGLSVNNKTSIYELEGPVRGVFIKEGVSPAKEQASLQPAQPPKSDAPPAAPVAKQASPAVKNKAKFPTKTNSKTNSGAKSKVKSKRKPAR